MTYYRAETEFLWGEGIGYYEIDDHDVVRRQARFLGDIAIWADRTSQSDPNFPIVDQPGRLLELSDEHEISAPEFEAAWKLCKEVAAEHRRKEAPS